LSTLKINDFLMVLIEKNLWLKLGLELGLDRDRIRAGIRAGSGQD
jgi:hypothetical protein